MLHTKEDIERPSLYDLCSAGHSYRAPTNIEQKRGTKFFFLKMSLFSAQNIYHIYTYIPDRMHYMWMSI